MDSAGWVLYCMLRPATCKVGAKLQLRTSFKLLQKLQNLTKLILTKTILTKGNIKSQVIKGQVTQGGLGSGRIDTLPSVEVYSITTTKSPASTISPFL